MKIFVIHYKVLVDRKKHILEQFKNHNITDYEFIEIDRDELHNHNIDIFEVNYSKCQIAILLSHFYAYKQIVEKYENALIFEDDVILSSNFTNILDQYMNELPEDYDMLFIGDGCNLHIENHKLIPNKYIYEKSYYDEKSEDGGITRCTDSYIMNKKCAIKICDYINNLTYKIKLPIDWWLNIAGKDLKIKAYWAEPTIVRQGTQTGLFKSSHIY